MKKRIKSAVISIVIIAVLLLSILIGVKNGTLDKLTKEMPTLETKQEETKKSAENESQKNESSNSVRIRNSSRRDIANVGQQFELRNNDVKYTFPCLSSTSEPTAPLLLIRCNIPSLSIFPINHTVLNELISPSGGTS